MEQKKNKGGRPRKPEHEKKKQYSVYLSPSVLAILKGIDSNLSRAIEKLIENHRNSLRGAAILEELRQQKHPSALAAYVHLKQLLDEIPAAVEKLLMLLGTLKRPV
ncbi:type II toxin-antitoxin system CcdA family antitoxin [Pseudomonas helleri]|uniref:hypothetical protein n=1 Tax=Pseudomonas helleri TaxID=1608996 RepID=UPI001294D7B9|nr:hypothetical protein [Pseudomonas helleri]MQT98142.1 hypothetical protein [Pseudomonas helleri]